MGAVIVSDVEVMSGDFGNVGDLCFTLLYVFVAFDVQLDSRFVGYVHEDLFKLFGFIDSCSSQVVG